MRRINGHGGAVPAPPDFPAPERINAVAELPIAELRQAWSEAWGASPPKGARRRLLVLGIAWKWQAAVHGGLSKPLERRLAALEAGHLRGGAVDGAASARVAIPRLMPGTRLIRVWKGERHEVQVDRDRLSLARPKLEIAVRHRPRDHRLSSQRSGLLRPAGRETQHERARGRSERRSAARSTRASPPRRASSRTSTRLMPSARPAPPMSSARSTRAGARSRIATMTAAIPAGRWSALPSRGCSPTSRPARSMW